MDVLAVDRGLKGFHFTLLQCIQELRDKAGIFKETGLVNIFDGDLTIVKSDVAMSDDLRKTLCEGVKMLEDVPNRLKDWHPRSDNMVLDLVHPSLFPVVYGLTKVVGAEDVPLDGCLDYIGKGETLPAFMPKAPSPSDSRGRHQSPGPKIWGNFQWLPTDVKLTDSGAKLQGYINNLHPEKHRGLYTILENVVTATVPAWQEALLGYYDRRRILINNTSDEDFEFPEGLRYQIPDLPDGMEAWYDPHTCEYGGKDAERAQENEDWMWDDEYDEWKRENWILTWPEPREYTSQAELRDGRKQDHRWRMDVGLREDFPEGLQVIFKLANIHLTPEKPTYDGGSWHVEGGLNETICASAIYYFEQENITDSHLAFRQSIDWEDLMMVPAQGEWTSLEQYLGIEQDGPTVQSLGQVLTREGRLLVFPNCVQHQVQSFSLQDKTKPGHRKILAMFLIDPHRRVLSTSNVPPQRRDWWGEKLREKRALNKLPPELVEHTINCVDEFPISWEAATEIREKLMAERSDRNEEVTTAMHEVSFCTSVSFSVIWV